MDLSTKLSAKLSSPTLDKLRIANSENKKRSSSDPPPVTPAKDSTLDPKTDAELIDLLTSSTTSHDTTLASLESQNTYLTSKITGLETSLKLLTPSAPKSYQHSLSSPNTSEFIPADLALTLETDPFTTLHLIKKNVGIWEWEGYDGLFKKWSKSQIPKSLKNLERRKSGSGIGQILDVGKGARNYTMEEFKERFNIEEVEVEDIGGGWNWVGGWIIDKNRYGVNEGGWIRGDTPEDIVASKTNATGNVRGRYLERVRCLRSFPEMSKGAEIFLREVESKAGLEVACKEMGEQVREMCERERVWGEKIERLERIAKEVPGLRKEIEKKNKELKKLMGDTQEIRNQQKVLDSSGGFAGSRNSSSSNSNEDMAGLDSKSPNRRRTSSGDGNNDWMKRIGRGGIVEKIGEGIRSLNTKGEGRRSRAGSREAAIDLKELEVDLETNL
ncbi:hypothetical protein TL16_g03890 [Triparma laevis f. inornata]|uniref:Uncharacterized protein n=1 Tax=Triparma laevis f. inornata TaxID=1714386 RepID=A0A9W7AA62_9STRA|nr:hypothetical protein TL16_g03890 [Triparma laevis f. inornata]